MEMEIDSDSVKLKHLKNEELFKAAESGDSLLLKSLSPEQLFGALSLRNEDERSLLHVAVSSSQIDAVEILSDAHASVVNSSDEEGWAPLHSAANTGNLKIIEILLNKGKCATGADVNLKNNGGRTALHYSASKGHLKIAEILISHGVKLNIKDQVGCAPRCIVQQAQGTQLCEFLIEEGAEVDADRAGQTPLMIAVGFHNREVKTY